MNRRSFVMTMFGGLAAASFGGVAMAQATSGVAAAVPAAGAIDEATKAALDQADADFSQVVIRERVVRRRGPFRRRPVVVRRRVIVRRPRRVIRRRVIVR